MHQGGSLEGFTRDLAQGIRLHDCLGAFQVAAKDSLLGDNPDVWKVTSRADWSSPSPSIQFEVLCKERFDCEN